MKLLIVDNSMAVRVRLSDICTSIAAVEVIQAAKLSEGFAQLRQFTPDAMILDLKFPDGNGLDLLRYARQSFPSVFTLVNSNSISLREHCLALGANHFFDKSLEVNGLVDAIIYCRDSRGAIGRPRAGAINDSPLPASSFTEPSQS